LWKITFIKPTFSVNVKKRKRGQKHLGEEFLGQNKKAFRLKFYREIEGKL
jgi:hypothetical protein